MTQTLESPMAPLPLAEPPPDRPRRKRSVPRSTLIEMGGSAIAALALVWLVFTVAGIVGPFGFAICVIAAFLIIYAIICWRLYGVLPMKDRLATLAIWTGALSAFIPLVGVILYVLLKGLWVVLADFPHFFIADMSGLTATSPVTAVGAGAAIVGTIEQVGLATLFTVPLGILTATYLVNNRNAFSKVVSNVVDAMTGAPAIIAGLFIYLLWVVPQKESGQTGFAAALVPLGHDAADRHPCLPRGHRHCPGVPQGSGAGARVSRMALRAAGHAPDCPRGPGHRHDPGHRPRGRGDRSRPLHRRGQFQLQLESVQREAG